MKKLSINIKFLAVTALVFLSAIFFCHNVHASELDTDSDGLSDAEETTKFYTDSNNFDTDGDGHDDGSEVKNSFSPLWVGRKKMNEVDSDSDGLNDAMEIALGTDLKNSDTDGDGYKDGDEVMNGYNPLNAKKYDRQVNRRVEVDLSTQKFYYFFNDVKIGEMYTSTGRPGVPTPTGEFKILRKVPVKTYYTITGGSYPNTKWNLEFKRSFYIHTAYWHNDFGIKPRSGGCVNLSLKDAEKMYKFLSVGDKVKVYGKTPVKPLKKAKIADSP